jgi:hypothetical protein
MLSHCEKREGVVVIIKYPTLKQLIKTHFKLIKPYSIQQHVNYKLFFLILKE